ncbi:hypothetical protein K439DRAFT_772887 [Ramaria rubella]|nr:hypothetical protein K439DRAFT_772887 [Ramaria rubella]
MPTLLTSHQIRRPKPGLPPPSSSPTYPASPSRPFQCEQCALSFDRSHDLKRHRESHSGARPYVCASCSRTFTRKDALKRHQSQKQCGVEDAQ